jgi:hypothetical protein
MGLEIDRESFAEDDYVLHAERLQGCIDALEQMLARPDFGVGPATLGAELEFSLIDQGLRPAPCNRVVLEAARHPRLTLEADRFDLECTTAPVALAGRPFTALAADLEDTLGAARTAATAHGARLATVGILPTIFSRARSPTASAIVRCRQGCAACAARPSRSASPAPTSRSRWHATTSRSRARRRRGRCI